MAKTRILYVSDSPLLNFVGQSRVGREICFRINSEHEVSYAAFLHEGPTDGFNYPIFPIPKDQSLCPELITAIEIVKPNVMIFSHDIWQFPYIKEIKEKWPEIKTIGYFTIDGEPLHLYFQSIIDYCDLILVPTRYGRRVVLDSFGYANTMICYFGVDREIFKPIIWDKDEFKSQSDEKAREAGKPQHIHDVSGKFNILFTGAASDKRNVAALIEAFDQFSDKVDDALLILLVNCYFSQSTAKCGVFNIDVKSLMYECRHSDRIYEEINNHINDSQLNLVYNQADVYCLPSANEGFSLTILEAMACGVPVLATNYSAMGELVIDDYNGFKIEPNVFHRCSFNIKRAYVHPDQICSRLLEAYQRWSNKKDEYEQIRKNCLEFASRYSWDGTANCILRAIDVVLNNHFIVSSDFIEV